MLYALGSPLLFAALLLGLIVGVVAHGLAQALVAITMAAPGTGSAGRQGDRAARARRTLDPRRHLDPFGTVAAAIAGVGWARPLEPDGWRPRAGRLGTLVAAGVGANLALAAVALAGYVATGGDAAALGQLGVSDVVFGRAVPTDPVQTLLLGFGIENLAIGLLSLVPLPPLDGGRLLFALAPRSRGWQQAEYRLVEQNWGLGILLVLLLLPLAAGVPLLLFLLDTVAQLLLGWAG